MISICLLNHVTRSGHFSFGGQRKSPSLLNKRMKGRLLFVAEMRKRGDAGSLGVKVMILMMTSPSARARDSSPNRNLILNQVYLLRSGADVTKDSDILMCGHNF